MRTRVIAIVSPVGGSGKTSVTVNLAATLGEMGRSSLIIDMDGLRDTTGICGFTRDEIEPPTIGEVLEETNSWDEAVRLSGIQGVDIVFGHTGVDLLTRRFFDSRLVLSRKLKELPEDRWDYVFIDTSSDFGFGTVSALVAADEALVMLSEGPKTTRGYGYMEYAIEQVKDVYNPKLNLLGGVVTMATPGSAYHRDFLEGFEEYCPEVPFRTVIRRDQGVLYAADKSLPVVKYASTSNAAKDFRSLALEFVEKLAAKKG